MRRAAAAMAAMGREIGRVSTMQRATTKTMLAANSAAVHDAARYAGAMTVFIGIPESTVQSVPRTGANAHKRSTPITPLSRDEPDLRSNAVRMMGELLTLRPSQSAASGWCVRTTPAESTTRRTGSRPGGASWMRPAMSSRLMEMPTTPATFPSPEKIGCAAEMIHLPLRRPLWGLPTVNDFCAFTPSR